jgi:hypothetical protein
MYVVLDSSVISEADWHLRSAAVLVLLEASRRGGVHLAVPEIVVREVTTKHREREKATITKLENVRASLRELQAEQRGDEGAPVEAQTDRFASDLRARLKDALVEIPPLDSATNEELVMRALARRRPFDSNGRAGYRDALIWHAILKLAHKDEVVLVSKDGDFATKNDRNRLHEHLVDDLAARGLATDRVRLFESVERAVRAVFDPADALVKALDERLEEDERFYDEVVDELREARHYGYGEIAPNLDIALESDAEPYQRWVRDFDLDDLVQFGRLRVVRAYPAGEDAYSVELTVDAEAQFRVEISTEAWFERPPRAEFEVALDERSFYVAGFAAVRLEFWSRYSVARNSFEDHELISIDNQ